ncbi:PREDICTED: regulatory protein NPR3-like [Populus euphratica]|uniref:Regulatory protein NPR3-like n=1 Tax=Populus euphratica TaxID=75702 RepID=A0AAJ6XP81_POPEU|nr:PREDICTED: regulatory protein NPR3-like [Populus euphratica]XP_011026214.1 PREDICTED: regulatory protein NPR3-like [Populus euphratica]
MESANEMTSSLSFASSSYLSNGSSIHHVSASNVPEPGVNLENLSLNKLSGNLERLLLDKEYDYSDAEIFVEGTPVGVHRCVLAARSQFFHELFKKGNNNSTNGDKPRYLMSDLVPYGGVGYEAFHVFLHYLYTGKLKPCPPEVSRCVDDACAHDACRPAINYVVELMCASATFQMKELVLLFQRRLLNFIEKALVEDVIPILMAAFHYQLGQLLSHCIERLVRSDLDSTCIDKELPDEISSKIKLLRKKSLPEAESSVEEVDPILERSFRRIHQALDSDDVELVELLLRESNLTLDDAYALHYAVAYCDPKIVKEVLGLGSADLNLRNSRGYSVLHVAARRKEPSIIMALLTRGASASETTLDGQNAVAICRRLTRSKDYNENTKQGQESNKDRICIDVLETDMRRRTSMSANVSILSPSVADDLSMKLDYLENRVAFARLLFPAEARLAMDSANANSTSMYTGLLASKSKGSSGDLREVDLNETPTVQAKRLQSRLQALHKTVETGRLYFPHCSEVLDKFLDDDMPDALFLDKGTPEEQKTKKMRFMELKDDVQKAFYKDMENNRSVRSSSSSSSSSPKSGVTYKARRKF